MQDDSSNPFLAVQVGNCVSSGIKIRFNEHLLNASITTMVKDSEVLKSMGGESDYVYTTEMNQGSAALSGGWGIGGLARLSSSVAGYGGKSSASMSKDIRVNFNVLMRCGQEFIRFNDLSPEDLLNSLSLSPRQGLIESLDAFTGLRDLTSDQLLDAVRNPNAQPEIEALLQKWITSTSNFFKNFGEGLVVGVLWGGIGEVSLTISNKASTSIRKYGITTNPSYEGIGASWSIKQAYDGGQSLNYDNVNATCTSYHAGACIADTVNNWFNVYSNKAFTDICELKPLDAPEINKTPPDPPSIPPFNKPKPDPSLADKFTKLSSLESLQAYAIASAYDKLPPDKDGKKMPLDEFIKKQTKPVDTRPLEELIQNTNENDFEMIIEDKAGLNRPGQDAISQATPSKKPSDDYTPLGVWIANWADLFPWLSTGYLNDFSDIEMVRRQLEKQVMMQDMLTLSRIYYYLAASNITTESLGFKDYENFEMVANKFQAAMKATQNNIDNDDAIAHGYKELDDLTIRGVYDFWRQEASFLRNAELGLAISFKGTDSVSRNWSRNQGSGDFFTVYYKSSKCLRTIDTSNVNFSDTLKGVPVIGGQKVNIGGKMTNPVYLFGPANMLLKSFLVGRSPGEDSEAGFSRNTVTAMKFTPECETNNSGKKVFFLAHEDTRLYPIRYSDATVGNWIGQTVSTNVGANGGLKQQLTKVKEQMSSLNALTLSSSTWDAQSKSKAKWSAKDPYVQSAIPMHYVGIVPEPENH